MTDLLDRLFDRQVCSPAQNSCRNDYRMDEAATAIAALRADVQRLTAERDRLRDSLTPSGETKAAYIGEFWFYAEIGVDEDGETLTQRVMVPWTTVKEIMAAILARAALEPPR